MGDKDTMGRIKDYLKHDRINLVQGIAKMINKDNASDLIAFKDGGLARTEILIKILSGLSVEKKYFNRLTGKEKTI